jgi:hypothetical protein
MYLNLLMMSAVEWPSYKGRVLGETFDNHNYSSRAQALNQNTNNTGICNLNAQTAYRHLGRVLTFVRLLADLSAPHHWFPRMDKPLQFAYMEYHGTYMGTSLAVAL